MSVAVDSPAPCLTGLGRWLTLHHLPQASRRTPFEVLQACGSIDAVFAANATQLQHVLPGKTEAIAAILNGPNVAQYKPVEQWLAQDSTHHVVVWTDNDYPPLLREIADPPLVLYLVGDRQWLTRPQIAVVGSRNPTPVGTENARAFARSLARAGFTITSGLALGVDGAAHRGALEIGNGTLAVCGTGLDRVYPARHRELAHAIAKSGALLSEFALGASPMAMHFPIRNRLISGLSVGTLVVEAALESGSLITARLALEQGREVFAIPGSIHSPQSRGCHALIRQGAKLVENAEDVLEELGALAQWTLASTPVVPTQNVGTLPSETVRLLKCLGHDPATLDALVERSGLTADAVSSMLGTLELEGLIAAMPGGRYQRLP